jgi:hypothetical protein
LPQFTVYCYIGERHRRVPIVTVDMLPSDWGAIKQLVKEAAIILFNNKHESTGILSIEKHLSGAFTMKWHQAGYSQKRLYFKRNVEFSCRFEFNCRTQEIKMANVQFGPELLFSGCLEDYRRLEKGIWKLPTSVIPQADQGINQGDSSTKKLLMQPSNSRYADYSRTARLIYQEGAEKRMKWQSYDRVVNRSYMPKSQQLEEEHEEGEGEEDSS